MGMSSAAIKTMQSKNKPNGQLSLFSAEPAQLRQPMCDIEALDPELRTGLAVVQLARPIRIRARAPRWAEFSVLRPDGSILVNVQMQPLRPLASENCYVSWTEDHKMPLGVALILLDENWNQLAVQYPHPFLSGQFVERNFEATANAPRHATGALRRLIAKWEAAPHERYP